MLVCLCRGVSEGELRRLVAAGVYSTEEISASCGAGGDCGACLSTIDRLVDAVRLRAHGPLVALGASA
jgi:bacterioferritin-associated ferredoxin